MTFFERAVGIYPFIRGYVGVVMCVVLVCCICFMSHYRILTSMDCPIMWHLCASERPCNAVAPYWSPMRTSRIVALGSCSVLLEYIRPGPGMPCIRQNPRELGRLLSFDWTRWKRGLGLP